MDSPARILIVEPNKAYLALLARRVAEAGFRVVAAESAAAAIAELHRMPVDLVLAGLRMAPTDGAELTRMIRGEVQWSDVPIILITARSKPAEAVRAYAAGADDVVLKPFHFEVLIARIERRIARARTIERLRRDNATLDARVVERAISLGELRDRLASSEAERRRLEGLVWARAQR